MDQVKTGDLLSTCGNRFADAFMQMGMAFPWSHLGVAVRYDENNNLVASGGRLCMLHIFSTKKENKAGITAVEEKLGKNGGNIRSLLWRPLKESKRKDIVKATEKFIKEFGDAYLTPTRGEFFKIWLRSLLNRRRARPKRSDRHEFLCTEFIGHYYEFCSNMTLHEIVGIPVEPHDVIARDFSVGQSPGSPLFEGYEAVLYKEDDPTVGDFFWYGLLILSLIYLFCRAVKYLTVVA